MPVYRFLGRHYETGAPVEGERFALNKQSLAAMLRTENVLPVRILEKTQRMELRLPGRRVSSKELALFTRQFSVMLDAGLPLVQCLGAMAEQQANSYFRTTLQRIREDVEGGATLAEAMRKHPRIFDTLFVNMVAAGEAGGVLDVILKRLSTFVEKSVQLKRAVLSASVYPSVVMLVAIVIVFVILLWVIPVFATLFEGLNAPLPLPTRLVMRASALTSQFALPLLLCGILATVAFRSYYGTEQGRYTVDGLLLKLPMLGPVLKKIAVARFSRTLATLLASGIPILEGLEITAHTAGNAVLERALLRIKKAVAEGATLIEPMKRASLFPSMVIQMVGVGEQTGELEEMLQKVADYFEEESDAAIADFLTLLEPLMIVGLGVLIGGIVISMYLPIFNLIGELAAR